VGHDRHVLPGLQILEGHCFDQAALHHGLHRSMSH
jgi:hypothetical protein